MKTFKITSRAGFTTEMKAENVFEATDRYVEEMSGASSVVTVVVDGNGEARVLLGGRILATFVEVGQ